MKTNKISILLFAISLSANAFGQHDMHTMHMGQEKPASKDTAQKKTEPAATDMYMGHDGVNMTEHGHKGMGSMSHAFSLNLPMSRNGSGTAWGPDAGAMYGYMLHTKGWMFMFHGDAFVRYNKQDLTDKGSRGDGKFDAPNMLMAMGQKKIGAHGLFHFNTMFSLDAPIAGGSGYPLLFQTGESWSGRPLVDRQHPHDLFSELSISYAYALSQKADVFAYVGYPGEPALGPVVFMHRQSGMFNPDAPIGHHWVDATHITFGVATFGFRYGKVKLEGSSFTGREPDENRYNFDKPRFDSWSARLSFNPTANWALQVSHGFIKSPEALLPLEDLHRTTASASYSYPIAKGKYFDATALWGLNKQAGESGSNSALLEANLKLKRLDIYMRYEWVQKSGEELMLDEHLYGAHTMYPINAITIGSGYDVARIGNLRFSPGAQLSMYHADAALDALYGKNPLAGEIYLHIYPVLMR